MKVDNLIINNVDSLVLENDKILIDEAFINNFNDNGYKWMDIYFIAKHVKTNSLFQMKARIESPENITFQLVTDEEYKDGTQT